MKVLLIGSGNDGIVKALQIIAERIAHQGSILVICEERELKAELPQFKIEDLLPIKMTELKHKNSGFFVPDNILRKKQKRK